MIIPECLNGEANKSTVQAGSLWIYWDGHRQRWVVRERVKNTVTVALELGRRCIGIELNPDYCELAKERCNVTPGLPLSA